MTSIGSTASTSEVDIGTVDTTNKAFIAAVLDYNNNLVASAIIPLAFMQSGVYGYCTENDGTNVSVGVFRLVGTTLKAKIAGTTRSSITLRLCAY